MVVVVVVSASGRRRRRRCRSRRRGRRRRGRRRRRCRCCCCCRGGRDRRRPYTEDVNWSVLATTGVTVDPLDKYRLSPLPPATCKPAVESDAVTNHVAGSDVPSRPRTSTQRRRRRPHILEPRVQPLTRHIREPGQRRTRKHRLRTPDHTSQMRSHRTRGTGLQLHPITPRTPLRPNRDTYVPDPVPNRDNATSVTTVASSALVGIVAPSSDPPRDRDLPDTTRHREERRSTLHRPRQPGIRHPPAARHRPRERIHRHLRRWRRR